MSNICLRRKMFLWNDKILLQRYKVLWHIRLRPPCKFNFPKKKLVVTNQVLMAFVRLLKTFIDFLENSSFTDCYTSMENLRGLQIYINICSSISTYNFLVFAFRVENYEDIYETVRRYHTVVSVLVSIVLTSLIFHCECRKGGTIDGKQMLNY